MLGAPKLPPLAWRNLTESRGRLLASVAGTAFAVTLMFMENGFRGALLDSMVGLIRRFDGEIFLVGRTIYTLSIPQPFPRIRLEQAKSFDGVNAGFPVLIETRRPRWRNLQDGLLHRIQAIGCNPRDHVFLIESLNENTELWRRPRTAMADNRSRTKKLGPLSPGLVSELSGRTIEIVGEFSLGPDFQNDGTLVMSEANFLSIFPDRRGGSPSSQPIDVGVLQTKSRNEPAPELLEAIRKALPADVLVLSKSGLLAKEQTFWDRVAPIGVVFRIGVVMGFAVGVAICYQVLYADISDRLPEFATLKAMGHSNRRLFAIVMTQAVQLSVLGYLSGLLTSVLLFAWVNRATGLPMELKPELAAEVFVFAVLMCSLSGLLAARRLANADPAQLFG